MDARLRMVKNFSNAAARYDALAAFQHTQTARVFAEAQKYFSDTETVVDIGCGTGQFALMAKQAQAVWAITGVDMAHGMCVEAATRCVVVEANATDLPFSNGAYGAAVSSLCLQWVDNLPKAFAEIYRVLKPQGVAIIATLTEQSLHELRTLSENAGLHVHIRPLAARSAYEAAAAQAGFELQACVQTLGTEYYADIAALLNSMRHIGAGSDGDRKGRGLSGAKAWRNMQSAYEMARTEKGIPATWEQLLMVVRKPV